MAATALIKFTQGSVGTPGQVFVGVVGTLVVIENNINTDVASWQIDLVYTPPGSAVPISVPLAFNDNDNTPTTTFTPDIEGPYRIALKVWAVINRPSLPTDIDIRVFWIPEAKHGFLIPPYQKDPDSLPTLASGDPKAKPNETNVAGQETGWDGRNTSGLLHDVLKQLDTSNFDIVPDPPVGQGPVLGIIIDTPADAISVWYDVTDDELWWSDKASPFIRRLDVSTGTPDQVAKFDLTASGVTMTRKIVTDTTHAFAAHLDDAIVTIINKSNNTVVGILDAGATRKARDVVVSGDAIYVSSKKPSTTGQIRKYSKAAALSSYPTPQVAALTLTNPGGGTTQFEEITIGGGKLWATSQVDQEVHKINLTTLVHEGSQNVAKDTQGVVYAFGSVWVTTGTFADVLRFNPGTFPSVPIATIATGGFGIKGITADGTRVFVSDDFGANFVKRINPGTDSIDGTVSITGSLADMAIDTTYLWVTNQFAPNAGLYRIELTGFTNDLTFTGWTGLDYGLLAGDTAGDFRANTVQRIQNLAVVAGTPSYVGKALRWSGFSWWAPSHHDYITIFSDRGSTDLGSYQAIGGFYFDPTIYHLGLLFPFGYSMTFEALLETTNVANSADLRLWNVTDSVSAGTLTSSSLTPAFVTTGLLVGTALPLAGKVYELQLKMGAGTTPDRVTCKMARFSFNT